MSHAPESTLSDLMTFIANSPTPFHTVANATERLRAQGFSDASPGRDPLSTLKRYYVHRDGSIIAWCEPDDLTPVTPFRILASHTDSPTLKVKPRPDTGTAGWKQVGVELYGNPLWNSWLDRELGVAGQLTLFDGSSRLVNIARPLLRIPQLAPHLDHSVNIDGLKLNPQTHLVPLWGLGEVRHGDFLELVGAEAEIEPSAIAAHDLYLHHPAAPLLLGGGAEFLAASRLDNLTSVVTSLEAFLGALSQGVSGVVPMFMAFNHEEIGSMTSVGAAGPMPRDIIAGIFEASGATSDERRRAIDASRCLSLDSMNATHPNYADRHDPMHHVLPNAGPALKLNADQHYASDATAIAAWKRACRDTAVPTQTYVPRNDIACGTTIGPQLSAQLGIRTIDVGIPILSMHSVRELCGTKDPAYLTSAATAFLLDAG
jgi:aspartyl aminopeptidase